MGSDIHAFVEVQYSSGDGRAPFSGDFDIRPFNTGTFFIWRDYGLFDALANGRADQLNEEDRAGRPRALYPPRGLPPHVSFAVVNEFHLWVSDESHPHLPPRGPYDAVTRAEAQAWVDKGIARWVAHPVTYGELNGALMEGRDFPVGYRPTLVTNPDWHHASWLTLEETAAALRHYCGQVRTFEPDVSFRAVMSAMTTLEQQLGEGRTRLVFWFD